MGSKRFPLVNEAVHRQVKYQRAGMAETGGLGDFSPRTFEEDDILFCFSICSYSRKYIRVFAR